MAKQENTTHRKHQCISCETYGNWRNPVVYGEDPYSAEINDDHTKVWLCERCLEDRRGGI